MSGLLTSILHRPYVFTFLAAFLFLAALRLGWRRTFLWLISGYAMAWVSEISSITNGFPYGLYSYVYENMGGELMVAGVPFFDSLSYAFLTFAGFTTAEYILKKTPHASRLKPYALIFWGAALTMLLDVIVDPIATMGDKWFLRQIHTYAYPGWYFGVPLTNFGGWFLVAFAIIGLNVLLWGLFPELFPEPSGNRRLDKYHGTDGRSPASHNLFMAVLPHLYPAFYAGIALFAIFMSFWVGIWGLGLASSGILLTIAAAGIIKNRRRV